MENPTIPVAVLILTIIITRITTLYIIDPNIIIKGFELHHIYYGIILLTLTFTLIKNKKISTPLYFISLGLIIDELEYALRGFGNQQSYIATLPSTIIFTSITIAIIIYWSHKK